MCSTKEIIINGDDLTAASTMVAFTTIETPYIRDLISCLEDHTTKTVTIMKGAAIGFTSCIIKTDRRCTTCDKVKPLSQFHTNQKKKVSRCKMCISDKNRKYRNAI